jgi:hypothetical protein
MWSPKGLHKTTFEVQFRMTTLGAPLLVSTEKKTFLSRCSTESSTPDAYKEDYLQQLIDERPDILPISGFIEDAKRVPVTSPEVLRRLLVYLGAMPEALREYDRSHQSHGKGNVRITLEPGRRKNCCG